MSKTTELGENTIIGNPLVTDNCVKFKANSRGNILFCEDGTDLRGSTITFNGDNALVYLSKNKHQYKLSVSMNRGNTLYIGKDNYFNGKLNLILSERKHIVIGDDGLFSFGIWLRTADPHLIYDCETHERINPSKNILIGNHVWIGQGSLVLKGSTISSGSIIGANSTVSGKLIPSNQSWAGAPAKKIAENIFFDGACVHNWTEAQTEASQRFTSDKWIFTTDQALSHTSTDGIFKKLDSLQSAKDRLNYLQNGPIELQGRYRFANSNPGENIRTETNIQRANFFSRLLGKKN